MAVYRSGEWISIGKAIEARPETPSGTWNCSASMDRYLYAPQYISGMGYSTMLDLVNLEDTPTTLVLQLLGNEGQLLGAEAPVTIAPLGSLQINNPAVFHLGQNQSIAQGYVRVKSSGARFAGMVFFQDASAGKFSTVLPFIEKGQAASTFSHVAQDDLFYTGLATINPNASNVSITIRVYSAEGLLIASGNRNITAGGRFSLVLPELVGNFPALTKGYFRVEASAPVISFAVFGTQDGRALSAIPSSFAKSR